MHATAYLKSPAKHDTGPVVVLYGTQRHLKQAALEAIKTLVLGEDDADAALTRFAGKDAEFKTVCDELLTVSMWGDKRLVLIEDADEFVSDNRAALEKYLAKPSHKSVLVLDVKSWPKTTRLAKLVPKIGLDLDCGELSAGDLFRWLGETSQSQHGKQLSRDAAALLVELAGGELGLLDQELAKLSAYVGTRARIEAEDVRLLVGGWKAETTWTMTNAVRDGDLGAALACLEKLLVAGEAPQRILGGINYVFKKYAQATELARVNGSLSDALKQAGVYPKEIPQSVAYLRRIGRPRAERLYASLLEADSNSKGGSRLSLGMQLEHLLLQLSGRV